MRVAVTGASGFIGQHVVRELNRRGIAPVVTMRKDSQAPPGASEPVELDISDPPLDPVAALGRPEVVVHLAWDGLPNYMSNHHFESELAIQYRFLKALVTGGLDTLLVTGTCQEYGMRSGVLSEEMGSEPVTPYGHAKDALRRQLAFLKAEHDFRLTWARLFYVWGPGQRSTSLYGQLTDAIERGDDEFPMSGGEQVRDYSPVSEFGSHLVSLALANRDDGVVNVCSGVPVTVRDLVVSWIAQNGWRIRPKLGAYPYPSWEPMACWGDRDKLDRILSENDS